MTDFSLSSSLSTFLETKTKEFCDFKYSLSAGRYCEPSRKKELLEFEGRQEEFFEILEKYPEVTSASFQVKDADGQPVFRTFSNLASFLLLPTNQWVYEGTAYNISYSLKVTSKLVNQWLSDLQALCDLCKTKKSENLLDYIIALRSMEVDLNQLKELELNQHPKELAFAFHYPKSESKEVVLILNALPSEDKSGSFEIPLTNQKLHQRLSAVYRTIFKVINSYEAIPKQIQAASKEGSIKLVVIEAHGNVMQIIFSKTLEGILREEVLTLDLFEGLPEDAVLFLKSCNTGKKGAIGEKIAFFANRTVFAPTGPSEDGVEFTYNHRYQSLEFHSNSSQYYFREILPVSITVPSSFKIAELQD